MAFKMAPRGGNNPKTGHGMPSALLQKSKEIYKTLDKIETEKGHGPTSEARSILKGYPQENNLKKVNSFNAAEQVQITKDSTDYISGAKNAIESKKLGKNFFDNYSTNNPIVKERQAARNNGNTEYQGVGPLGSVTGKGSGSVTGKENLVWDLQKSSDQLFGTEDRGVQSRFGIPVIGTTGNPKTDTKKKLVPRQMKSESPAKMKVSKKTAYDIKEASNQKLKPGARKHYAENAQAAMKNKKGSAAKMKKC
jgi:hypothetical protein